MENAVKALEYAFAVLVFVIGLSASIYMLSEVKNTSDIVFSRVDTKQFYTDVLIPADELEIEGKTPSGDVTEEELRELNENGRIKYNGRIVNVETIVPTLYRYYKENYIVEFYDLEGNNIIKFDLSQETTTRQLWTANPEVDAKKRLDIFLNGIKGKEEETTAIINSQTYDISEDIAFVKNSDGSYVMEDKGYVEKYGLYDYCKDKKFSEEYAYVPEVSEQKIDEDITRIVIRYKEVQ